jgi:hypothetical protein
MQYFSKNFSKAYLNKPLVDGRDVQVLSKNLALPVVYMKVDKGQAKRAMITTRWCDVVSAFDMKPGDIYLFWFHRASEGGLKLIVKKV